MLGGRRVDQTEVAAGIEEISRRIKALEQKAHQRNAADFYSQLDDAWRKFHEVEEAKKENKGGWERLKEALDSTLNELNEAVERA